MNATKLVVININNAISVKVTVKVVLGRHTKQEINSLLEAMIEKRDLKMKWIKALLSILYLVVKLILMDCL